MKFPKRNPTVGICVGQLVEFGNLIGIGAVAKQSRGLRACRICRTDEGHCHERRFGLFEISAPRSDPACQKMGAMLASSSMASVSAGVSGINGGLSR